MTKARGDLPDTNADLSEAARAVVRDAGDPRTDAYLTALGLVDAPAPDAEPAVAETALPVETPPPVAAPVVAPVAAEQLALPVAPASDPEVATLRARVADLEAQLAAAASRARMLGVALAIAVVAVVVLVALVVSRPA